MTDKKTWYVLGGIGAINAAALYGVFRVGATFFSILDDFHMHDRVIMVGFFLCEAFIVINAIGYFVNILSAAFAYERPSALLQRRNKWPSVIVFLPMRNEELDVVRKTFAACSFLTYQRLSVVVVDSSDERQHQQKVKQAAQSFGLTYFSTPYPRHGAKAGALNEAMAVHVAPYYMLFDADYHPVRDCIQTLVAQMEAEPNLAYIQTPQFYGNLGESPVSRISQIQQSIFYEFISEGKSVHNSMFMCGTNLMIRREAIMSVGGWDEQSVTEDFSTSMALAERGWDSRYDNRIIAFGMGPVNLLGYLRQQYRWARGTFGAFFKNFIAFFNPFGMLSLFQRIEYTLSGIYFFVGIAWMFLIVMPVIYIFFRIPGYSSDPFLFSIAYLPYLILSFAFYGGTMRHRRFRIRDLLRAQSLTLMTLPVYVVAFFHALVRHKASFITTKKSGSPYDIPWDELVVQLVFILLNVIAVLYGLFTLDQATNKPALMTNIAWATFHSGILLYFILQLYVAQQTHKS